jgi:hypothetical protein
MALGSTHSLVKMSTRNIPGGKGGRCVRLTTSPPSCAECRENLGACTSWNPLGHTRPVMGRLYFFIYVPLWEGKCLQKLWKSDGASPRYWTSVFGIFMAALWWIKSAAYSNFVARILLFVHMPDCLCCCVWGGRLLQPLCGVVVCGWTETRNSSVQYGRKTFHCNVHGVGTHCVLHWLRRKLSFEERHWPPPWRYWVRP